MSEEWLTTFNCTSDKMSASYLIKTFWFFNIALYKLEKTNILYWGCIQLLLLTESLKKHDLKVGSIKNIPRVNLCPLSVLCVLTSDKP